MLTDTTQYTVQPLKMTETKAVFETGAQRSSGEGKGRYDLIPTRPVRRLAKHYEKGANAYGARNWEKGMPFSRLIDSAKRHIDQYLEGDRSEDHLAAVAWNVFALMHFEEVKPELNDVPNEPEIKLLVREPATLLVEDRYANILLEVK